MRRLLRLLLLEAAARLARAASADMKSFVIVHNHERMTTTITTDLTSRDAELLQDAARRCAELRSTRYATDKKQQGVSP